MYVRSQRVSSTYAWRGRLSRRSEIFLSGEVEVQVGWCGMAVAVFILAAAFFLGFPVACLGAAMGLGSGFSGLPIFLVVVTIGCLGASMTS